MRQLGRDASEKSFTPFFFFMCEGNERDRNIPRIVYH